MKRILLGQLGSNGDCLYATTVARQIKHDFPGCHLTWGISSLCQRVIEGNPDVDDVWVVPLASWQDMPVVWRAFEHEAWTRVGRGEFDHAFMTQIYPGHVDNYDGTVRPSIFRNYPRPITVPIETVIHLSESERARTRAWATAAGLDRFDATVLFECSSKSGQSFMTPALAVEIAGRIVAVNPRIGFVLSTIEPVATDLPQVVPGGALSLRETAELTHLVDLFVGCGSGVTVVATSGAANSELGNIQVLDPATSIYASFKHDFEYFGKDASRFLETTSADPERLAGAILTALEQGIAAANARYGETIPVHFSWYISQIEYALLSERNYLDAARSLLVTAGRYGWSQELLDFGRTMILPFVTSDPKACYPSRQSDIARLRKALIG